MANFDFSNHDSFGSKIGVIAAAACSAIGLGNIWCFPYITGENEGGAFLVVYIIFIVMIGLVILAPEVKRDLKIYLSKLKSGKIEKY